MTTPKKPSNGVSRLKEVAWAKSTVPAKIGMTAERRASAAATLATGIATRETVRTPSRLIPANVSTTPIASGVTGIHGRYHSCSAVAERMAVKPQVGTQPHQ